MFTRTFTVAAVLALATAAHAVPVLGFGAAAQNIAVGDSFELVLQGSGFDSTAGGLVINNLSGGQQINLLFSVGALELLGITIDPRWTFAAANKPGTVNNAAGTLTGLAFGTFPATADDSFDIARITFRALSTTPATVVVTAANLAGRVNNVAGTRIAADFATRTVSVSPVPEPHSWALLAAGLGWLALRSRSHSRRG